jgi:hypothetical protein
MKKLMFVAAIAAGFAAFGDGIESANTVGYNTLNFMAQSTFYMMGSQFETTDGAALKLSDLNFGDMTGAPYFDDELNFVNTAPQVRIAFANQGGFTTYYFLSDGAANMIDPGWVDGGGNPVDPDVAPGIGFWFYNNVSATPVLTTAGAVPEDSPIERTFTSASFRVLVNPFPVAAKLSDIDFGDIATTAPYFDDELNFVNTATQIRIPFSSQGGFTTYYYLADGAANMIDPGWVDGGGNPVDPEIPVGRGCWFKPTSGSITVTFTAP